MKILALEFSTEQRSVALVDAASGRAAAPLAEARSSDRAVGGLTLVDRALAQAGLQRGDVNAIAVGLGPGSYTGIRVALATAQGWQLATGVETRGVSSAECLAHQAAAHCLRGTVAVVIDAQRGEFYLGLWRVDDSSVIELEPLRIASSGDVVRCREAGASLVGTGLPPEFGAALDVAPDAGMMGRLAAHAVAKPAEALEPVYLREAKFVKAPVARIIP